MDNPQSTNLSPATVSNNRGTMTLEDFISTRRRLKSAALATGLSLLWALLLVPTKSLPLILPALPIFAVSAVITQRCLKKLDDFRCPQCGKDPTTWVSTDPTVDTGHLDMFTQHCLHCRFHLGEVD